MQNKKWLSLLCAIVVSLGLWVYVVTVENPEGSITIYNIPVTFSGQDLLREDYDLLITDSNVANGVELSFTGKRSVLTKLQESKSELQLAVNVTYLRSAQTYSLSYDINDLTLPSSVSAQDLVLGTKDPSAVTVTLENQIKKTVPIVIQQNVRLQEGYMTDRLTQNYAEVVVEGPQKVIDQISKAQAVLDRENVGQTITATLPLTIVNENGEPVDTTSLSYNVTEVEVTLPVLMYKDVPLEAPLIEGGGATSADVVLDIKPKSIRLSGDPSVLESLTSIKLSNVDLSSMMTNSETLSRTIVIPEGCTNISGEQEASVNLQIKNKSIRQMRISSSNFQYIGLSAEYGVNFKTTLLLVTIRAGEKDISQITEDNLRVVADFTSVEPGDAIYVPVKIYIDGFEGAGVVAPDDYRILVDIVPADEMGESTEE